MQIGTVVKRTAVVGLAVLLLAALLWTVARSLPLTDEQRAAIAILEQAPEFPGRNAFGLLWTMGHEVPEDRIEAVLEEDARRIAAFRAAPPHPSTVDRVAVDWARDAYPAVEVSEADRAMFCGDHELNCIEKVANDSDSYRALIGRHSARLDRIESLADFGHIDLPWTYGLDMIDIPPLGGLGDTRTRHALWFVEGRVEEALAHSCRAVDTWRRLGRHSDSLILRMLANAYAMRYHGVQLAEMLAAIPAGQALPPICDTALAPPEPDELSLCNAMRGEFEIVRDFERLDGLGLDVAPGRWLSALVYDMEAMSALTAERHARQCGNAALARIRDDCQDDCQDVPPSPSSPWRFACLGNLVGCRIEAASAPAYNDYRIRMLDFGFQLRALATLAWLHREHPEPVVTEALLERRPEALQSPARALLVLDEGRALGVPLYSKLEAEPWRLPLPAKD